MITCIVPARNEQGNLRVVIGHVIELGLIEEIIIVEGGSTDDTLQLAKNLALENPSLITVISQSGRGKFNAVLEAATHATGDLVMIWDADGTVPPSHTVKIIELALQLKGSVIGDRLHGNMQKDSMRFANFLGNWFFAWLWTPLLKSSPKDLLCGTKIFPRDVYIDIPIKFTSNDPYGDFALILNSIRLGNTIHAVPVDYDARAYGVTNIHRWSGGVALLIFTFKAFFWKLTKYRTL